MWILLLITCWCSKFFQAHDKAAGALVVACNTQNLFGCSPPLFKGQQHPSP